MTTTRTIILNSSSNEHRVDGDGESLSGQKLIDAFIENDDQLKKSKEIDAYFKKCFRGWTIGYKPHIIFENMMTAYIHLSASPMSEKHSSLDTKYTKEFLFELMYKGHISKERYDACFKKPHRLASKVTVGKHENIKLYDLK
jgi:hypothetical protein